MCLTSKCLKSSSACKWRFVVDTTHWLPARDAGPIVDKSLPFIRLSDMARWQETLSLSGVAYRAASTIIICSTESTSFAPPFGVGKRRKYFGDEMHVARFIVPFKIVGDIYGISWNVLINAELKYKPYRFSWRLPMLPAASSSCR